MPLYFINLLTIRQGVSALLDSTTPVKPSKTTNPGPQATPVNKFINCLLVKVLSLSGGFPL